MELLQFRHIRKEVSGELWLGDDFVSRVKELDDDINKIKQVENK